MARTMYKGTVEQHQVIEDLFGLYSDKYNAATARSFTISSLMILGWTEDEATAAFTAAMSEAGAPGLCEVGQSDPCGPETVDRISGEVLCDDRPRLWISEIEHTHGERRQTGHH